MAKQLSFVSSDTPISGVTTNPINLELVNFGADFVVKDDAKKGEVLITNSKAPVNAPENFRIATSMIEDAYKGSTIEPNMRTMSKKGVQIYIQHTFVMKETDTTDSTYEALVPVKGWMVLQFPYVATMTADIAEKALRRFIPAFYLTGANTSVRMGQLLRSSLLPPDLR